VLADALAAPVTTRLLACRGRRAKGVTSLAFPSVLAQCGAAIREGANIMTLRLRQNLPGRAASEPSGVTICTGAPATMVSYVIRTWKYGLVTALDAVRKLVSGGGGAAGRRDARDGIWSAAERAVTCGFWL